MTGTERVERVAHPPRLPLSPASLAATSLLAASLCSAQPQDAAAIGKPFCAMLDLAAPGMERVAAHAGKCEYAQALAAYRDHFVRKVRGLDYGHFRYHDNRRHYHWPPDVTDQLVGKKAGAGWMRDMGLSGKPGSGIEIDWLARTENHYADFQFSIRLAVAYQDTRDPIYLLKWIETASGFARNQRRTVETSLSPSALKSHRCNWQWRNASSALHQGIRAAVIIKCLATFAKWLPDGSRPRPWHDALQPARTDVLAEGLAQMPPLELAEVAISLVKDYPPALLERYMTKWKVPNQRFVGLYALCLIARTFSEFKAAARIEKQAAWAVADAAETLFHTDGGMLEQSFNYNIWNAGQAEQVVALYQPKPPAWLNALDEKVKLFRRLTACMSFPMGGLPRTGTTWQVNPPPVWKDVDLARTWKSRLLAASRGEREDAIPVTAKTRWKARPYTLYRCSTAKQDALCAQIYGRLWGPGTRGRPAFTSAAFPYSGYYGMRSDWSMDGRFLSLLAFRPARGHGAGNSNAITVAAFGRHLLVSSGPSWYYPSMAPKSQRDEFSQFVKYFGEGASLGKNTVVVDGESQSRNEAPARRANDTPIPARWHTSRHFDLAEGTYASGYGPLRLAWKTRNRDDVNMDVSHTRQVIFARDLGLWIVTDRMHNKLGAGKAFAYTQLWNFPPHDETPRGRVAGFGPEQVLTDERARCIRTADPDGSNVFLYHFAAKPLRYARYCGHKNPHFGWYATSIGGEKRPAPDVHVNWSGAGDQVLLTVIIPTQTMSSPVQSVRDLSMSTGKPVYGFEMAMKDGCIVAYQASTGEADLQACHLTCSGEALLVMGGPNKTTRGIALACDTMRVNGVPQHVEERDFEFEVVEGRAKIVSPVRIPTGFRWDESPNGIVPAYWP